MRLSQHSAHPRTESGFLLLLGPSALQLCCDTTSCISSESCDASMVKKQVST